MQSGLWRRRADLRAAEGKSETGDQAVLSDGKGRRLGAGQSPVTPFLWMEADQSLGQSALPDQSRGLRGIGETPAGADPHYQRRSGGAPGVDVRRGLHGMGPAYG